jgi:predicted ester cyclase
MKLGRRHRWVEENMHLMKTLDDA